jgi:hypothetical protein
MSQAEVKGALGSDFAPTMTVLDEPFSDFVSTSPGSPPLQVLKAMNSDLTKRYNVVFSDDKAIVVGFWEFLKPDAVPTGENLRAALVQKYGPPTDGLHWAFDPNGSLIKNKSDPCYRNYSYPGVGPADPSIPQAGGGVASLFSNYLDCSMDIYARVGGGSYRDRSDNAVHTYSTYTAWLLKEQVFTDAQEAAKKAGADAAAAKQRAQEQVKPDL